jgi:hypothetical protein
MRKSSLLFLVFLSGYFTALAQKFRYKPENSIVYDSTNGEKIIAQCSRDIPKNISHYWNITRSEIDKLENNFKRVQLLRSKVCCNIGYKVKHLKKYGFQYTGVTILQKKYIYLNAFISIDNPNWENRPIVVCDGGMAYWGVLFNIEDQSFSELSFNGWPID